MARPSKQEKAKMVPRRLLYTTNEAATLLCCARQFLLDELKTGKLGYVLRGTRKYVPAAALDKYIEERTRGGET